jgi:hypothetical protein
MQQQQQQQGMMNFQGMMNAMTAQHHSQFLNSMMQQQYAAGISSAAGPQPHPTIFPGTNLMIGSVPHPTAGPLQVHPADPCP